MPDSIVLREDEEAIWIILNRPEKRNALDTKMIKQLVSRLEEAVEKDPSVIVLASEGDHFCVGSDIQDLIEPTEDFLNERKRMMMGIAKIIELLHDSPVPTISMVKGSAFGVGMALALATDLTIASEDAVFSAAYAKIGLTPHGTYFLTRLLGEKRAKFLVFTAARLSATEALKMGVVNKVVPLEELEDTTLEVIKSINKLPKRTLALAKELLNYSSVATSVHKSLAFETMFQTLSHGTQEFKHAMEQYSEKKKEKEKGKEHKEEKKENTDTENNKNTKENDDGENH